MRFSEWWDKVVFMVLGVLLTGTLSWSAYLSSAVSANAKDILARPNRDEVGRLIETNAPYMRDRALILSAVDDSKQNSRALREAIQANTQAVIELRAVIDAIKDR